MSKKSDDLEMVTFQPFGEETMQSNQEEIKASNAAADAQKSPKEIRQSNKSKSDKFNGVIIGLILLVIYITYDVLVK